MKKNFEVAVVALAVLNIFTLFKLYGIENSIDMNFNNLRSSIYGVESRISGITSDIYSALEKQGSILDNYEVVLGDKLNEDLTIPVKVTVTPKEYSEELTVSIFADDREISMLRKGTSFAAEFNTNIFGDFLLKAVLDQGGVKQTESLEKYYDMRDKFILQIDGSYLGHESYNLGKYKMNGEVELRISSNENNAPEKAYIVYELNGEKIKEQQADIPVIENQDYITRFISTGVSEEFEMKPNDKLIIYAHIEDSYGINYKYIVRLNEINSSNEQVNSMPEWTNGTVIEIKDKKGNVLYVPEYIR